MPQTSLKNAGGLRELDRRGRRRFRLEIVPGTTAAGMCYTSVPRASKGVVYSHRSNVLHSMIASAPDAMGVSCSGVVLPVVPMFHATAGALRSPSPDAGRGAWSCLAPSSTRRRSRAAHDYRVTSRRRCRRCGLMLLQYLEANNAKLPHLKKVVIGGSACPRR